MPVLFTEAARFQSWLDAEAALVELTIIPAEMPDSSIQGMRIGLCFRRSLISASGQLRAIPAPEVHRRGPTPRQTLLPSVAERRNRPFFGCRQSAHNSWRNGIPSERIVEHSLACVTILAF